MKTYPVSLVGLADSKTVVIGGGIVALRKVESLLEAAASVTIVSPKIVAGLEALLHSKKIEWVKRSYKHGDLENAFVVIAATNDPVVNQAVWEEARQRGCLINVVDDPTHSNFIVPALVRRDELTFAISTGGASPAFASWLKEQLESAYGEEYGALATLLSEIRPFLISSFPSGEARAAAARQLINSNLIEHLKQGEYARAKRLAVEILQSIVSDEQK